MRMVTAFALALVACNPAIARDGEPGPQGEPGPPGPRGPRGNDGAPGPRGAIVDPYMVEASTTIEPGEPHTGYTVAECDEPDHVLMTGGCSVFGPSSATPHLYENRPGAGSYDGTGHPRWLCAADADAIAPLELVAVAVCSH